MAGQDYKRHIPAGGSTRINANGETYIFCKFSDRDVTVDIAGRKVVMRTGSYMEFAPLRGENSAVTIYNDDTERPAAVLFVLGVGTYDEKLVRGEISIEPILRRADGTTVPDTRQGLSISMEPENLSVTSYVVPDIVAVGQLPVLTPAMHTTSQFKVLKAYGGYVATSLAFAPADGYVVVYDKELNYVRSFESKFGTSIAHGAAYNNVVGLVRVSTDARAVKAFSEDKNDTGSTVYTADADIAYFTRWKNNGFVVCKANGEWDILNENAERVTTITPPISVSGAGNSKISYNAADGLVYHGSGLNVRAYDPENNFNEVYFGEGVFSSSGQLNDGFEVDGNTFIDGDASKPTRRALKDFTTKPEFSAAIPGCSVINALYRTAKIPQISAEIEVVSVGNGVQVTGEVIKAALEYYYKRKVEGDYLDSVYSFDVTTDENGNRFRAISTGNRSFSAAGVADNFGILTPGNIALTIDETLKLGEFL